MRLISILVIGLALVSASGCFGKDDENGDTPATSTPTTTPTGTTPTRPTGSTPTATPTGNNTGGDGNTTTRPAPREVFSGNANFQQPPGDPQNPVQANPFAVPTGYTKLTLNVTWASAAPVIVQNGVSVVLVDPAGTALGNCGGPGPGPAPTEAAVCTVEVAIPATGGDYNAEYHGVGTLTATVSVMAS